MRAHTPQQSTDASRRRSSVSGGHRTSFGSSLPRASLANRPTIAAVRAANSQPTYDFLTGAERPPSRSGETSLRRSTTTRNPSTNFPSPADDTEVEREKRKKELEELKVENNTLKYTVDNHKQEEELAKLRHESELRDARRKGEDDFKKMQAAEGERSKAVRQYEMLLKEITEVRDAAVNTKAALESKVRKAEESKRLLEEEVEEMRTEREESARGLERKAAELESRNKTLQQTVEELQQDYDQREALLQDVQQQLSNKDTAYGALEAEVLKLKAQTGDVDTLAIIKRELSEQVAHIRKLEVANREQAAELKHFKRIHKSVEVVEEEKRSLQRKLEAMEGLENELGEARIQRQRLEDERLAWTAYLQSQGGSDGQLEFDSPEALARALVEERIQTATLAEKIGELEPELSAKDSTIQALEKEKASLTEQTEQLRASGGGAGSSNKALLRLERQKALAIKEAEYLRAQLKTYDAEDTTFQPENIDESRSKRISELEDMVNQYRQEVQTLHGELATKETSTALPPAAPTSSKRPREDSEDNELLGQHIRKQRKLQDELSSQQNSNKLLQKELAVAKERLTTATQRSSTRILSLRSNPTSDFEAIKQSTLTALRAENTDLLAQLQSSTKNLKMVPASMLETRLLEIQEAKTALTTQKTRLDRHMKVWSATSAEFRQSVISLLGWNLAFMKDGKVRVSSSFYPSKGDEENSIIFDGERGTLKISGGPESDFAVRIGDQLKFWVREKGSVPCFLAALTLEFYDEANRDGTLMNLDV